MLLPTLMRLQPLMKATTLRLVPELVKPRHFSRDHTNRVISREIGRLVVFESESCENDLARYLDSG